MRHYSALVKQFLLATAAAMLLTLGARPSGAQVVFDDLDWTTDRGNIVFTVAPGNRNAIALRPGRNGANGNSADPRFAPLDGKRNVLRWVWPTPVDINPTDTSINPATALTVIVDNPYLDGGNGYLRKYDDTRFPSSQQSVDSLSVWTPNNGFTVPIPDDRASYPGFSFSMNTRENTGIPPDQSYPPEAARGDYGYTYAHHNDFIVDRAGTLPDGPATEGELASLPNADQHVYAAVQKVLTTPALGQPIAQWTLGATLNTNLSATGAAVPAGTYNVSIYSPSGGTYITHNNGARVSHTNVQRAFVRVSWGLNTVAGNNTILAGPGTANGGGVNDPVTSRIFLVDLSAPGWIPIGAAGSASAVFPYDGNPNNQIVVTLYSVTPDDPNDQNIYGSYTDPNTNASLPLTALVTADACRFTQENVSSNTNSPGLGPLPNGDSITASGVIVSPVAGSNKFAPKGVPGATQWYVARQELTRDLTPRSFVDPTNPNSTPIPDPTAVASVPVFYCLSNEDQLADITNPNSAQASKLRVLWRFVGYPDGGNAVSFASPVVANVRGRDGQYHTMVYFCGTDGDTRSSAHIYALDAVGNPATATTTPYWIYPSIRPLSAGETNGKLVPAEYEDPNYNGSPTTSSTVYPTDSGPYNMPGHWWAKDLTLFSTGAQKYFDGDIVTDTSDVNAIKRQIVRTSTRIHIGGVEGTPLVIDDVDNPGGQMILVVPSTDGRLYTFDAGGRGDYIQGDGTIIPGTTQRLWSWPHYGADAYHHYFTGINTTDPENAFQDEVGKGPLYYSPAYDPTFPFGGGAGVRQNPLVVSAGDGHVYGVKPFHDLLTGFASNGIPQWEDRRFWVYPHQGSGLNDPSANPLSTDAPPGVPTIYRTGGTASVNFTSAGRVYSITLPNVLPNSGYSTPGLRWVFPNTPNPPFQDPTDPTTAPYPQGFSPIGLVIVPQSVTNGQNPGLPNDMVYALTTSGDIVAVNYPTGTFYSSGHSEYGSGTESAPIIAEVAPDPRLYAPVRSLSATAPTVPAIIFGDSYGFMSGFKLVAESDGDPTNPYGILPIIYERRDSNSELAAAPALAASTVITKTGGYYVVGDTSGQLYAYSFGSGQFGDVGTTPGGAGTGLGGATDVTIDVRAVDAYSQDDYNKVGANATKPYGTGKTSARQENGNPFTNTATPLPPNLNDGGAYFALDQGGKLYLIASGVYHAQPNTDPTMIPADGNPYAVSIPTIKVVFTVSQNGQPPKDYEAIPNPLAAVSNTEPATTGDPAAAGPWPTKINNTQLWRWPDDRSLTPGEHDQLHIFGLDYSNPANPPNPMTNPPSGATQLTGRAQNVYPWVAKVAVDLLPTSSSGGTTFVPNSIGYSVNVRAAITQTERRRTNTTTTTTTATDFASLAMGQRADKGKSLDPYGPSPNDNSTNTHQSKERQFYITNPLALTVRGFTPGAVGGIVDQTGSNSYNMIGWYGGIDNPDLPGGPTKGLELIGNGAYVGIGGGLPGQPGTGYTKPLFAPFDMAQDNSSTTYQGIDNNGQRKAAFYIVDRSALALASAQHSYGALKVKARISPLRWTGTTASVMNPLPFDVFPDNPDGITSLDYPSLDPRYAKMLINNNDALRGTATLTPPRDAPGYVGDVRRRIPQPTPVIMSVQVPKYFPANVNRGQIRYNFRGQNIDIGGTFTDQAGFIRGVRTGTGGAAYNDETKIIGPLNTVTGRADGLTNPQGLVGSSPAGGYTGDVEVEMVAPGSTTQPLASGAAGLTRPRRGGGGGRGGSGGTGGLGGSATDQAYRKFQTGLSVAPTFRMKVLESTLDMGNVPHGTGYSDMGANTPNSVGYGNASTGYPGSTRYRYPFAPAATGQYAAGLSSWDINDQYSGLALGAGFPSQGRFFHPFTLISDSNVNLVNLRVAKLLGIPNTDASASPNMGAVINNASLSQNPISGIARAARLYSDQVNNLLSPPMIAAPFGMTAGAGTNPSFLGNIGVVSSFDHDSYSQSILGENNLYPIANPAVDQRAVSQAAELYSYYGPALFGPQWAAKQQSRPSLHKPRVNDSSGSIATIPDKPHDFDYQANTLNATTPNPNGGTFNYVQQQQQIGLFAPPAMAIAVPLGTPVGTYSAPIFPYEDALPIQWQEWLNVSTPVNAKPADILGNNDDILNTTLAGAPSEPFANPAPNLKVAVREARLTEGATAGTMPQIDVRNNQGGYDPIGFNLQPSAIMVPQGSNGSNIYNKIFLYWATNRQLDKSPSGTGNNGQYQLGGLPTPFAPYNIAYSGLNTPYALLNGYYRGDADFGFYKNNKALQPDNILLPQWWSANYPKVSAFNLLPGYDGTGLPLDYLKLFPQATGSPDVPNPASVRYGSPATTLATQYNAATGNFEISSEAYLTAQGSMDKVDPSKRIDPANPNTGPLVQKTETRTFVASLNNQLGNSELGAPDYSNGTTDTWLKSFANDPNLPKLSPRPLLVRLRNAPIGGSPKDIKFLYVFWYAGAQGRTSLYYNVNVQANGIDNKFDPTVGGATPTGFAVLGDQKLSTPGSLTWQSDPYPVFRRAFDPVSGQVVDSVDVMFTGQLKNRQTVEILMGRYRIVEQATAATTNAPAYAVGQLVPIPFPTVHQESLTPVPGTNTYAARDAAWFLPSDQQASDAGASATTSPAYNRFMRVYVQPKGVGQAYLVNGQGYINGATNTAIGPQRGRIDPASGLVYFSSLAVDPATNKIALTAANRPVFGGGQLVVDARSGTVSFPNIPPGKKDAVYASYTPYILRVNTSRDEFNIERDNTDVPGSPALFGNFIAANFPWSPAKVSSGQNYGPTLVMDRAANFRGTLQSPQVLFGVNNQPATSFNNQGVMTGVLPPIARMWTLYRKTDAAGSIKASVFMKSMRLMAHLPLPVATVATNGTATSPLAAQRIQFISVTGMDRPLTRGYEVDWIRGRVYFQEEDEGNLVRISYTWYNPGTGQSGSSGNLYYRIAWSDEISSTGHPYDATGQWKGDQTTDEVAMPTSSIVNEGQVAAFKDPFIDKLWVFWSSTRAGTTIGNNSLGQTDLYYETLAPQFNSPASNQY